MPPKNPSRRAFLYGRSRPHRAVQRPPWASADFTDKCNRCNACIENCETGVLKRGEGGFPQVDFRRNECNFCKACITACEHDAFKSSSESPWDITVNVNQKCLAIRGIVCRTCSERCEYEAIHFELQTGGRATPHINGALCTGCGACISVCPENAINQHSQNTAESKLTPNSAAERDKSGKTN